MGHFLCQSVTGNHDILDISCFASFLSGNKSSTPLQSGWHSQLPSAQFLYVSCMNAPQRSLDASLPVLAFPHEPAGHCRGSHERCREFRLSNSARTRKSRGDELLQSADIAITQTTSAVMCSFLRSRYPQSHAHHGPDGLIKAVWIYPPITSVYACAFLAERFSSKSMLSTSHHISILHNIALRFQPY